MDLTLVCRCGGRHRQRPDAPAGPLRAPLEVQLRRNRCHRPHRRGRRRRGSCAPPPGRSCRSSAPFRPARIRDFRKGPILAYAGIGRPQKLLRSAAAIGRQWARTVSFPDHHRSRPRSDAAPRRGEAGNLRLVTTEKDLARIAATTGPLAEESRERGLSRDRRVRIRPPSRGSPKPSPASPRGEAGIGVAPPILPRGTGEDQGVTLRRGRRRRGAGAPRACPRRRGGSSRPVPRPP